jgi:phosphoserine phosphatase RsbX
MTAAPRSPRRLVDWGLAARTMPGEASSGDLGVVAPFDGGVLLAAVDGLGHGAPAAAAAERAAAILQRQPGAELPDLVRRCHDALADTRGVVLSVAAFSALRGTVTWMGVGNVEGLLLHANPSAPTPRETLLLRGGVVGYQLPPLVEAVVAVGPGDVLLFATDGVRTDFTAAARPGEAPQHQADRLLRVYGRGSDDALVLAAQILGPEP